MYLGHVYGRLAGSFGFLGCVSRAARARFQPGYLSVSFVRRKLAGALRPPPVLLETRRGGQYIHSRVDECPWMVRERERASTYRISYRRHWIPQSAAAAFSAAMMFLLRDVRSLDSDKNGSAIIPKRLVQGQTANLAAHGSLGQLGNGKVCILDAVAGLDGVYDLVVEHAVQLEGDIVHCDCRLGGDLDGGLLERLHVLYRVEDWHHELQSGCEDLLQ